MNLDMLPRYILLSPLQHLYINKMIISLLTVCDNRYINSNRQSDGKCLLENSLWPGREKHSMIRVYIRRGKSLVFHDEHISREVKTSALAVVEWIVQRVTS